MIKVRLLKSYQKGFTRLTLEKDGNILLKSELHSEYIELDTIETFFFCFREEAFDSESMDDDTQTLLNIKAEDIEVNGLGREFVKHLKEFQDEFKE